MGIAGTETQWKEGAVANKKQEKDQSNWSTVREL